MKINLGYVALPLTLPITSSQTMTYHTFQKLGEKRAFEKLDQIIHDNFQHLYEILMYNVKNNIVFFRITSALIPLGTHPMVNFEIFKRYQSEFQWIGNYINQNKLRVDLHPDQFCVLNSDRQEVVDTTISMLEFYQNIIEAMGIDGKIILHVGGKAGGKRAGLKRFEEGFNRLSPTLQKMILLENDDKVYNIRNVLSLCEKLNIPMVLDYHHHLCNRNQEKIEDFIERIFNTWNQEKLNPKIHFSSPKNKKEFRSHSEYIDPTAFIAFLERIKWVDRDFDIMLECKCKDEALFRLIRQLKHYTDYKFEQNAFFLN